MKNIIYELWTSGGEENVNWKTKAM